MRTSRVLESSRSLPATADRQPGRVIVASRILFNRAELAETRSNDETVTRRTAVTVRRGHGAAGNVCCADSRRCLGIILMVT